VTSQPEDFHILYACTGTAFVVYCGAVYTTDNIGPIRHCELFAVLNHPLTLCPTHCDCTDIRFGRTMLNILSAKTVYTCALYVETLLSYFWALQVCVVHGPYMMTIDLKKSRPFWCHEQICSSNECIYLISVAAFCLHHKSFESSLTAKLMRQSWCSIANRPSRRQKNAHRAPSYVAERETYVYTRIPILDLNRGLFSCVFLQHPVERTGTIRLRLYNFWQFRGEIVRCCQLASVSKLKADTHLVLLPNIFQRCVFLLLVLGLQL